jgi:hypothetical protein
VKNPRRRPHSFRKLLPVVVIVVGLLIYKGPALIKNFDLNSLADTGDSTSTIKTGTDPLNNKNGTHTGLAVIKSVELADARRLIKRLSIGTVGSHFGYSRGQFGPAWTDNVSGVPFGHNGCKTRDDVLNRDLTHVTVRPGTSNCVVIKGLLADPYTGKRIAFVKSQGSKIQIDHVAPLSYAWGRGAASWTLAKREQLANDPLNLLAVDGVSNQSKSDSGPAEWMPDNQKIGCAYGVRLAQVSLKYHLTVTRSDEQAMLDQCKSR